MALLLAAALLTVCSEAVRAFCFADFAAGAVMRAEAGWPTWAGAQGGHSLWTCPTSVQSQKRLHVSPAAPWGAVRQGGIKAAWFLVVRDAANGFDCERSGSVRDRGSPPAILFRPEVYRAQVKSAGGWRATVSGHDAGRGCCGGCVARSPARGDAAGAI